MVGIGGQHTRFIRREVFNDSQDIDFIISGEGEETVRQINLWLNGKISKPNVKGISFIKNGGLFSTKESTLVDFKEITPINYDLYPQYKKFFPLIEDSRGCPFSCNFCSNKNVYNSTVRFKKPLLFLQEVKKIAEVYETNSIPIIFYNSIFGANPKIAKEILLGLKGMKLDIKFLASTRVDSGWGEYVKQAEGLCDQMHFGLESGSSEILLRMEKTTNAKKYLKMAETAFKEFHKRGIHVAVNILTGFCGENRKTLKETENFIEKNKENIDSIRSHPLILFPGSPFRQQMEEFGNLFSSKIRKNKYSDRIHAYPIDASSSLTFEDAINVGKELMRKFNSFEKFYDYYKWLIGPMQLAGGISFVPENKFAKLLEKIDPLKFDFKKD